MIQGEEHNAIRVLRADPDLARRLDAAAAELARRHTVAPLVSLPAGPLESIVGPESRDDVLGYLVVDGLLLHSLEIAGRRGAELLGAGDFVSPRSPAGAFAEHAPEARERWHVLVPARIAILDGEFGRTVARWPGIMAELFDRTERRAWTLAFQLALSQAAGLERRLLILLWSLAGRWGSVTPEGVELPLRLSHRCLGEMVLARRPSVTTALGSLVAEGSLRAREPHGWILPGDPPDGVCGLAPGASAAVAS